MILRLQLKVIAFLFAIIPIAASAQVGAGALTARGQASLLQNALGPASTGAISAMPSARPLLADIEQSIGRANPLDASLRAPVPELALRRIQINQLFQGRAMTLRDVATATDTAQALMRRSPGKTLPELVDRLSQQEGDAAFHGNVAELAEARAREMILTKNPRSQMWDLTEDKFRPTNYQMKIYAQSDRALQLLHDDLDGKEGFIKRGITTQETLNEGLRKGTLEQVSDNYRYVGQSDIELEPSRVFLRPTQSWLYTQTGRKLLQDAVIGETDAVAMGKWTTAGKWLGRAAIAATAVIATKLVYDWREGYISDREFYTNGTGLVGALAVGWGGAQAGAAFGAAIPPPFDVVTVPLFGFLGGVGGAFLGDSAAESGWGLYYEKLDAAQKLQVEEFTYQYYGLSSR